MRHTVIGIFDTYDQAEVARSALVASGFAHSDIELQAAPQPSSPDDPSLAPGAGQPPETGGVLANIERFFSMLFGGRDQPPEVAHYSEAVRRGGILVAVDTPSEDRADSARQTLAEQGAIDIDERAASWGTLNHARSAEMGADDREHSLLDELGLGSGSAVPGRAPVNPAGDPLASARADANRARAYPHADRGDPSLEPLDPISPVARDPFAGSSDSTYRATGGDPMTSGTVWQDTHETARPASVDDPLSGTPLTGAGVRSPAGRIGDPLPTSGGAYRTSKDESLAANPSASNPAQSGRSADPLGGNPLAGNDSAYRSSAASEPLTGAASTQGWRPVDPLDESETSSRLGDVDARVAGSLSQAPLDPDRPVSRNTMPDEYMEYEDDFRTDYASKYAATGARYEEYEDAYRYGATAGSDERYRSRDWDDTVESELQRDWLSRHPRGEDTWERFKLAVRHGWDRVTGHHHM